MFSKTNPYDEIVAAATDENLTSENWELILGVCDKVSRSPPDSARDCITAVSKRFTSRNANVQLYALTLAEALVKNCDIAVHREISSRMFTNALTKMIHDRSTHESVRKRALEFIQMCSHEFQADTSLGLMNEVYHNLRSEGIQFPNPQKPKKEYTQSELDKQKEEEELQLALALSLSESENQRSTYRPSSSVAAKTTTSTQAISATASGTTANQPNSSSQEAAPKVSRVRALYDFQPTEQGELGFQKGDIIRVIESVYRDWWKGELKGQTGIFPVNYVEKIVDPTPADLMKEAQMEAEVMGEIQNVERLLDMLSRIDPQRDSFSENEELQNLYNSTLAIRPKLVRLIEKYSLKKDELVALNEKFLQARTMYDRMLGSSIAKYTSPPAAHNGYMPHQYVGYEQHLQQQPQPQPQPQQQQQQQQPIYSAPPQEPYMAYQANQPYGQGYPVQPSPVAHHQQPQILQQQQQQPQQSSQPQTPQQQQMPQQAPYSPPAQDVYAGYAQQQQQSAYNQAYPVQPSLATHHQATPQIQHASPPPPPPPQQQQTSQPPVYPQTTYPAPPQPYPGATQQAYAQNY